MIGVVYHNYLIGDWKIIVSEQLKRLKDSGLYDECDIIWATVNLNGHQEDEYKNHVKEYDKLQFVFEVNNGAEYPGIKKVKELGDTYDDIKILYFHTKGVSNDWTTYRGREKNEEKIKNIRAWRECLEYFLIDKWRESVEKFNYYDNVGVTCNNGWFWGNFWWSQSNHIRACRAVDIWGRWSYEAWMNDYVERPHTQFEWYKFTYNPYVTFMHEDWYKFPDKLKGSKIILHKALYGTPYFEIDEGYDQTPLGQLADVTSIVDDILSKTNYEKMEIVTNNTVFGDPTPGFRKFLYIDFSLDINPEKIYRIGSHEGSSFELNFNKV